MKKLITLVLAALLILSLTACSSGSKESTKETASNWPEKSINFVIGFKAGGGADITARAVFQPFVEDILGQKFVISYLEGSNGEVSYTEAATTAAKDGYTMYWIAHPGFLTIPLTKDTAKYKLEDITPVARLATDANVFIVPKNSEFNSLKDLVDYATAHPGELNVGDGALNADDDLALEQWLRAAGGITVNKVVYSGGTTDRVTAVLGGHVQMSVINASEVTPYIDQVKVLGLMAKERVDFLPDVPTFAEQGYEVYNASDRGVMMPGGVDEAIVAKLSDAIKQAMNDPKCQEVMKNLNLTPAFLDYKEFKADLQRANDAYKEIISANQAAAK